MSLPSSKYFTGDVAWDVQKNGPSVSMMRSQFVRTPIIRLGRLALWNHLNKKVVDLKAPTVGLIEKYDPAMFEDVVNSPMPEYIR